MVRRSSKTCSSFFREPLASASDGLPLWLAAKRKDCRKRSIPMRKILFALLVLAAVVIGLGYYLEWFTFSSTAGDKPNISLTVDKEKIGADVQKAKEKITTEAGNAKEKIKDSAEPK
jgi:hypothetical protein